MTDTKISANWQPENMTIDYVNMRVGFTFGTSAARPDFRCVFTLPIKASGYGQEGIVFNAAVDEADIKALCLKENHSLADFEAIRLGLKSFLRGHEVYTVNGNEYRVRREDILCEIVKRVIKGEKVTKAENRTESEAA